VIQQQLHHREVAHARCRVERSASWRVRFFPSRIRAALEQEPGDVVVAEFDSR
jgi:hypothetical protein